MIHHDPSILMNPSICGFLAPRFHEFHLFARSTRLLLCVKPCWRLRPHTSHSCEHLDRLTKVCMSPGMFDVCLKICLRVADHNLAASCIMSCILCASLILMARLWLAQALVKIGPLRSASHFPTACNQTWLGAMTLGPPPFRPRDASTRRDLTLLRLLRWTLYRICLEIWERHGNSVLLIWLGEGRNSNDILLPRWSTPWRPSI